MRYAWRECRDLPSGAEIVTRYARLYDADGDEVFLRCYYVDEESGEVWADLVDGKDDEGELVVENGELARAVYWLKAPLRVEFLGNQAG